jgi:hypothetical protein
VVIAVLLVVVGPVKTGEIVASGWLSYLNFDLNFLGVVQQH